MTYKKYSNDERATMVAFLIVNGFPYRKGSALYTEIQFNGVCHKNLKRWYEDMDKWCGGLIEVQAKVLDIEKILERELEKYIGKMDEKINEASFRELSYSMQLTIEKLMQLRGLNGSVNRTETVVVNGWLDTVRNERQAIAAPKEVQVLDPRTELKEDEST